MTGFYFHLDSNVQTEATVNTLSNFTTTPAKPISLGDGWCVGLSEISYSVSWYNVTAPQEIFLHCDGEPIAKPGWTGPRSRESFTAVLSPGSYPSPHHLCQAINKACEAWKEDRVVTPSISFNESTKKVEMTAGAATIGFSPTLANMLGIPQTVRLETFGDAHFLENIKGSTRHGTVDMKGPLHSIFVYTDIVEHGFIGDTLAQLLRIAEIPNNLAWGEQKVIRYDPPQYMPLQNGCISSIQVRLKDDAGRDFPFQAGRTILTLHFKKNESS